ncbi:DUF1521 domain-containing protein [Myxococcus sp. RHSTA-1-4]|uniref:DUF1521 domain-containing protein n=1 Tax=Myxococcus sp. RHSTA-1-4 TaxID=2874601 RepID=UPI001CBF13ED|nr:DUF1521 domain-containing protein [Myxococcus sp. RHSTA-1-4]MBZ4417161.1 DUF1521 domain-containing protein [Myxococcus sp. RHSTA-1-4]
MSSGISQLNINARISITTAPGLSETELAKNKKLIDSTVDHCLAEINSAVAKLKSLEQSSGTSSSSFCGTPSQASGSQSSASSSGTNGCFPSEWPDYSDYFKPKDKLKVDSGTGTITTPGGYKIEQLGQFEWKISGPDGKSTRVWGDPHVDESDGGKFDFKRNTTFSLPDGTEIHVTTKPWGNSGMTVTGQLDITNGHDHVTVSDIDKGKGKVSAKIEKDGYETKVGFKTKNQDILHMGKETDDWSFKGREVIGDNNGGETFKLGNLLQHGNHAVDGTKNEVWTSGKPSPAQRDDFMDRISKAVQELFDTAKETRSHGFNPFRGRDDIFNKYDKKQHRDGIQHAFRAVKHMFRALDEINKLNDMVSRRNFFV